MGMSGAWCKKWFEKNILLRKKQGQGNIVYIALGVETSSFNIKQRENLSILFKMSQGFIYVVYIVFINSSRKQLV
jgi:hypothetical protein